jgi:hypothetical protein
MKLLAMQSEGLIQSRPS